MCNCACVHNILYIFIFIYFIHAHVYFLYISFILLYLLAKLSGVDVDYLMIKSMTVLMIAVLPIKTSSMVFDQNSLPDQEIFEKKPKRVAGTFV